MATRFHIIIRHFLNITPRAVSSFRDYTNKLSNNLSTHKNRQKERAYIFIMFLFIFPLFFPLFYGDVGSFYVRACVLNASNSIISPPQPAAFPLFNESVCPVIAPRLKARRQQEWRFLFLHSSLSLSLLVFLYLYFYAELKNCGPCWSISSVRNIKTAPTRRGKGKNVQFQNERVSAWEQATGAIPTWEPTDGPLFVYFSSFSERTWN